MTNAVTNILVLSFGGHRCVCFHISRDFQGRSQKRDRWALGHTYADRHRRTASRSRSHSRLSPGFQNVHDDVGSLQNIHLEGVPVFSKTPLSAALDLRVTRDTVCVGMPSFCVPCHLRMWLHVALTGTHTHTCTRSRAAP